MKRNIDHALQVMASPLSDTEPSPPEPLPRRYSSVPFPAYRFVPGCTPHPTRNPRGHSYGIDRWAVVSFDPREWRASTVYLHGVDLFNYVYWWEAHEAWEGLWMAVGRRTPSGRFLQGLIQVSVAHLKWFQGLPEPARRLLREGFARMTQCPTPFLGIEVACFQRDVEAYFAATRDLPPVIQLVGVAVDG